MVRNKILCFVKYKFLRKKVWNNFKITVKEKPEEKKTTQSNTYGVKKRRT